jgi:glycosyltransferase involved in cell wall biosynthesis
VKVLHVQKSTGIGGSERYLLALLPGLAERGVDVRMLVLGAAEVERFAAPLRSTGISVTVIPAGPDFNPVMPFRILKEIRRFRPDIVHTHLIHADLYGQIAARIARVPGIETFHGSHPFFRRQPYLAAARLAGRLTAGMIAVSHHVERFVTTTGIVAPEKLRVIYIGVDALEVPSDATRSELRAAFGMSDADVVVGVASRLVPQKGHEFLIRAFGRASAEVDHLRLLIAGDGSLQSELEALARTTAPDAIRFLGFVDDVPSFMAACDLVVLPTMPGFGEGLSVATLEAQAAGRPVVATSVDSLPEIVLPDETGYLVAPGDVDELAIALVRLAGDKSLRDRLGAAGLKRAREVFRVDRMVDETFQEYVEVVGAGDATGGPTP